MNSVSIKRHICHVKVTDYMASGYEITKKVNAPFNPNIDRERKEDHTIRSARISQQRSHQNLFAILRCQCWSFFVTLTFGNLTDDEKCRKAFQKWREDVKVKFPNMYYVAVPEYQARGVLHYHLVVGGVSLDDLKCVDSGRVLHYGKGWLREDFDRCGFKYDDSTGEGKTIYNIGAWKKGFSTLTEVRNIEYVIKYVGKYITKNTVDPRFFNKRRFHCSHNILRPFSVGMTFEDGSEDTVDSMLCYLGSRTLYRDDSKVYEKFDIDLSKEERIKAFLYGELPS